MIFGCQRGSEFETSAAGVFLEMDKSPKAIDSGTVGPKCAIRHRRRKLSKSI